VLAVSPRDLVWGFHRGPNLAPLREGKWVKEYKVTVDQSLKAENDPKALEKKMQELGREGWELKARDLGDRWC
jgi:hypothetical protein